MPRTVPSAPGGKVRPVSGTGCVGSVFVRFHAFVRCAVGLASFPRQPSFPCGRRVSWCGLVARQAPYVTAHEWCLACKGAPDPCFGQRRRTPHDSSVTAQVRQRLGRDPVSCVAYLHEGIRSSQRPSFVQRSASRRVTRRYSRHGPLPSSRPGADAVNGASLELSDTESAEGIEVSRPLVVARSRIDGARPSLPSRLGRAVTTSSRNATWLILPVVICLSQRLSHACVSMN